MTHQGFNGRRLLLIAERDVLLRALVAAALIVALGVALFTSAAHAAAVIDCDRQGCHEARHVRHASSKRPADCYGIPWCGCWARHQVGIRDKSFNLARHWLVLPHVRKRVGAWAVMRHHVGRVVAIDASGNVVLVSGNHNGRVGRGVYPARRIIAYVEP